MSLLMMELPRGGGCRSSNAWLLPQLLAIKHGSPMSNRCMAFLRECAAVKILFVCQPGNSSNYARMILTRSLCLQYLHTCAWYVMVIAMVDHVTTRLRFENLSALAIHQVRPAHIWLIKIAANKRRVVLVGHRGLGVHTWM